MTSRRSLIALASLLALLGTSAHAQSAAEKQLASDKFTLVAPFPAGGPIDTLARVLADGLAKRYNQVAVVDNAPGASGNIGMDKVKRAKPDGHTLLLCDVGALAISPAVYTKLSFDPSKDLRGVTMLAYSPHMLAVHPSVKANNLKELVALSKTSDINFAVTAVGSAPHVAGVAVERATGAKWTYVPYKGGSQAVTDTVAGQTQVIMNGMLATLPHVQNGRLKVLGISKKTRMPLVGDVPTLAEAKAGNVNVDMWYGIFAPKGMPAAQVSALNREINDILAGEDVKKAFSGQGMDPSTGTPEAFGRLVAQDADRWAKLIKAQNIKAE